MYLLGTFCRLYLQFTNIYKFWSNQDVLYDYRADLHGIRNCTIVMQLQYFYALYTSSFKSISQKQRPLEACFCILHVM